MDLSGVNMITCGNVNCYVLRGSRGDILIDTGTAEYRDFIETWLHSYNVKLIAITHGHNDHIGSAAYFKKLYDAKIAMCAYDINLARDNKVHKIYPVGLFGKAMLTVSKKLMSESAEPFKTDIFLDDDMLLGDELGIDCKVLRLDGHTKGSCGFLKGDDLYIGDAAMNFISPSFPAICESPKAARASLEKVRLLNPKRIFFGHGNPVEAGTKEYESLFDR